MPLTVEVDPSNPNKVNVTGDGFAFTATLSGARIDLTGVGRTVTAAFVDPQADIQWSGGGIPIYCSSHYSPPGRFIEYPMHFPYAAPYSLGNVSSLSEVFSYDVTGTTPTFYDFGMSGNNLFFSLSTGEVYRVDLTTGTFTGTVDTEGTNPKISVIDDSVAYCKCTRTTIDLLKLNFDSQDYVVAESWNDTTTFGGDTIYYEYIYWMIRAKFGTKDYLISAEVWSGDAGADVIQTMIYDVTTDTLIDDPINYVMSGLYYYNVGSTYAVTTPSMYQYKVAFTWSAYTWDADDTVTPYATFIVDMEDNTVTKVSSTESGFEYGAASQFNSGVDQDTGIYYVVIANYDETPNAILAVDLTSASPAYSVIANISYTSFIAQGDRDAYVSEGLVGGAANIRGPLPVLTLLKGSAIYDDTFIDTPNNVAWVQTAIGTLTGYNLGGGTNSTITLNYDSGNYKYPSQQVYNPLMMFNGTYVVQLSSRTAGTPYSYQRQIFAFK